MGQSIQEWTAFKKFERIWSACLLKHTDLALNPEPKTSDFCIIKRDNT